MPLPTDNDPSASGLRSDLHDSPSKKRHRELVDTNKSKRQKSADLEESDHLEDSNIFDGAEDDEESVEDSHESVDENDDSVDGLKWRAVKIILNMFFKSEKNQDGNEDVLDWFEDVKNVTSSSQDAVFTNTKHSYLSQLMICLRECLLTCRWSDALYVLNTVMRDPTSSRVHGAVWRVGCQLLAADHNHSGLLDHFIRQLKQLSSVQDKHVMLEYVLHLLTSDRLGDAEHALRNLHIVKKGRKKQAWEKDLQYAHALLTGYEGLVYYTRWRQISTQLDECMKLPFGSSSQTDHEQSMKNYADRANKCFEKICSNKEIIVDIFITKHVELLEYYDEHEAAKEILQTYKNNNSSNPNAHKFYYNHLKRHQGGATDRAEMIACLQELCDAVPSDSLALELHELMCQNGQGTADTLCILFDYLDYFCRKNDNTAWQRLSEQLTSVYVSCDSDESAKSTGIVKRTSDDILLHDEDPAMIASVSDMHKDKLAVEKCWKLRQSWWPGYHWTDTEQDDLILLENKAIVACLLQGKDCEFVKYVASKSCSVALGRVLNIMSDNHD